MSEPGVGPEVSRKPGSGTTERICAILRAIGENVDGVTVAQLAGMLELSRSTTSRFVRILEAEGFLGTRDGKVYSAGWDLYRISTRIVHSGSLLKRARGIARDLARGTNGTALLVIYERSSRQLFWAAQETADRQTSYQVNYSVHVGDQGNLRWGASAKTILANLDDAEQGAVLEELRDETVSPTGVEQSFDELVAQLHVVRERGYAVSHSESVPHTVNVAAAIFGAAGEVTGAISVSTPEMFWEPEGEQALADRVKEHAAKLGGIELRMN